MKVRSLFVLAASTGLWSACTEPAPSSTSTTCDDVEIIVASGNYQMAAICGAPTCDAKTGLDLGADPQLASTNGRTFFLARDKDLIFEIDPRCGTVLRRPVSVDAFAKEDPGTGIRRRANPHDVAAAPDGTVVVPLYSAGKIVFVRDGAVEQNEIDLSGYDPDGNPQADAIRVLDVGGVSKAFVTLERLDDNDGFRSKQGSQMLRIDVSSRAVEAVIDLEGRNPFNAMAELGTFLYMAEPGNFDDAAEALAGIERFDTATSTPHLLVRERDLGGSVAEVAVTEGCGVAIVAGPEENVNPTSLVTFDPTTGRVLSTQAAPILGPTPGYDLQGLAWRGRRLYVGDRRRGAGGYPVHVFEDRGGCSLGETGRTLELPYEPIALRAAR